MSLALTADEPRLSLPRRFVDLLPGLALPKLTSLLAVGSSIWGVSAIIAARGAIAEVVVAIATLILVLVLQPWLPV